jgi:hypothetical protein
MPTPLADDTEALGRDTVVVTRTTRFHTAVGTAVRVEDLSANPPELLVPEASGTFTRIHGKATREGYRFTGVPAGAYYLRTSGTSQAYVISDARKVDVGTNMLGREDAVLSPLDTVSARLDLSGLEPWESYVSRERPGSALYATSGQLDFYSPMYFFARPEEEVTSLSTTEVNLSNWSGATPVFEAERGDRLYVYQTGMREAGPLLDGGAQAYSTVVRGLELEPFSYVPDEVVPLPITGTLQPVPMTPFSLDWRLSAFASHAAEVHPEVAFTRSAFNISAAAFGLANGYVGYSGALLEMSLPTNAAFDFASQLAYGNPFPATWGAVGNAGYTFNIRHAAPDGSGSTVTASGSLRSSDALEALAGGPIVPRISPPRGLTIDGESAWTRHTLGTTTPVLAWQAPGFGTATAYLVDILKYWSGFESMPLYATLYMGGSTTQVRLPPGMLEAGGSYVVRVRALHAPGFEPERLPFSSQDLLPRFQADTVSGLFTIAP